MGNNTFITGILPEMVKMDNVNQFSTGDRLFYEMSEYKPIVVDSLRYLDAEGDEQYYHTYNNKHVRSGSFKEVKDPEKFVNNGDPRWNDKEWLNHHNFMIIKSK